MASFFFNCGLTACCTTSRFGTFETCRAGPTMSVIRSRPEVTSFRDGIIRIKRKDLEIWKKDQMLSSPWSASSRPSERFKYMRYCRIGPLAVMRNSHAEFRRISILRSGKLMTKLILPKDELTSFVLAEIRRQEGCEGVDAVVILETRSPQSIGNWEIAIVAASGNPPAVQRAAAVVQKRLQTKYRLG